MAGRYPYPVPNPTVPYWRTKLHELDTHRSTPELPERQDVVIIGAGFTGAAVARYLLEDGDGPKPSVTILEAREVCSGASGRNGGQLRPALFAGMAARMQARGLETATEVARFEVANARAVVDLIESEGISKPCELRAVTTADAFVDADEAARAQRLWDAMSRLGGDNTNEERRGSPARQLLDGATFHGGANGAAERATGVRGAKAVVTFGAHLLRPYALVTHLLAGAVARGANLQTRTAVREVLEEVHSEDGYRWTVATARGAVRARQVVLATNAYTAGLLPEYDEAIYAARGTACRVLPSSSSSALPIESCGIQTRDPAGVGSYFGVQADGSLVVGAGGRSAFGGDARDRAPWFRNFDDATLIAPAVKYFEGWAGGMLVGWEGEGDDDVEMSRVDSVWTGIMGQETERNQREQYSADEAPHVGAVPDKPGLYICAGFHGHGMPNVLLCARAVAAMARDGAAFADTGVPACYETSAERLRRIAEGAAGRVAGRARADIYLKY
ncbi:FAD dependent oxidoreductase [Hypoxylon sp. FL1284]|nr:FAD dependent oxidoreductase [Hypoxylon sp. FL1284]